MHAADTLSLMGHEADSATSALVKALDHKNEQVVWHVAQALGTIASDPKTVVPALAEHLDDKSPMVRVAAALALGNYGNEADAAVTDLAKALSDDSVDVRVAAARSLGAIGPDAKAAVPQLDKALDDQAGIVTLTAFEALGAIKGPAVRVLARRLQDEAFLPLAAAVLGSMGPDAAPATIGLVKQLRTTKEPEAQLEILVALASIGPKAEAAIEPLIDLAKKGEGPPKRGAVYALAKIGAKKAVPIFQQGVKQTSDAMMQRTCAWALVTMEPDNQEYVEQALPRLMAGLSDERPLVRKECAVAIRLIGPEAKAAVPELLEALANSDPEVQAEVLDALAHIGPAAKAAIPAAVKKLGSDDPMVRYTASHLLGQLGGDAKDAAPALEKLVDGQDEFGRAVAVWALVKIDPSEKNVSRAIPLMIKALGHERPSVRAEAAETLGQIGKGNAGVKSALQKAASDEDETVQTAARKALAELN